MDSIQCDLARRDLPRETIPGIRLGISEVEGG